LFLWGANGVHL